MTSRRVKDMPREQQKAVMAQLSRQTTLGSFERKQAVSQQIARRKEGKGLEENPHGERLVQATMQDIDAETATNAYRGISWTPEDRSALVRAQYVAHMNALHDELIQKVPEEKYPELQAELERYQENYLKKKRELLHSQSRILSTLVTGASNFPARRNEKRNRAYDKKLQKFHDWQKRAQRAIKKELGIIKTPISGSDSDAVNKIEARIKKLQAKQEHMKKVNKIIRSKKKSHAEKVKELQDMGYSEAAAEKLFKPDFAGRTGVPGYMLKNNNANIRRLKKRAQTLKEVKAQPSQSKSFPGGHVEENPDDYRVRIHFDEKPPHEVRDLLKSRGFRWSPRNMAWQRKLTNAARADTDYILKKLKEQEENDE
jgi:hypothetical protein